MGNVIEGGWVQEITADPGWAWTVTSLGTAGRSVHSAVDDVESGLAPTRVTALIVTT